MNDDTQKLVAYEKTERLLVVEKKEAYIQLKRDLPDWVFQDAKLLLLVTYIARKASRTGTTLMFNKRIVVLNPGEFVIGRKKVAEETELTEQEFRTRYSKLIDLLQISTIQVTSHYTVGKLLPTAIYDINTVTDNQPSNQLITNQQPADNQLITTNKNVKKEKNVKNVNYEKLAEQLSLTPAQIKDYEIRIQDYMASTGKRYKDIEATIRNWYRRDAKENKPQQITRDLTAERSMF